MTLMEPGSLSAAAAGLGLGIALAGAPGPVQVVLLTESVRGGLTRGFRAMAGANFTFGVLIFALALGVSLAAPTGLTLRILKVAGGGFLIWIAVDAFRSAMPLDPAAASRPTLPPEVRGVLAVILNPGAWLFLATAASSLFSTAVHANGTAGALLAALGLLIGLMMGDAAVVLLGGVGIRRAGDWLGIWVRRFLATGLAALGLWLVISGFVG
jgi:threonine/homoserine/homoserine lactone efflux protein